MGRTNLRLWSWNGPKEATGLHTKDEGEAVQGSLGTFVLGCLKKGGFINKNSEVKEEQFCKDLD